MTATRLISLPLHGALEMLTGLALMAAPLVFDLQPAGGVTAVFAGVLIVGLALSAADEPGRGTLSVGAHWAFDNGAAVGLFGAAAVLALSGDGRSGLILLLAGTLQFLLTATTRYTLRA